jgi:hypothetical protein
MSLAWCVFAGVVLAGAACERATPPATPAVARVSNTPAQPPAPAPKPAPAPETPADDAPWLPKPLPRHGFIVGAYGMGGSTEVVIDYDARTLRDVEKHDLRDRKKLDRTVPLSPSQLDKLRGLATAAVRERPNGDQPEVTDVSEQFYMFDGDQRTDISGTLFDAREIEGTAWRPFAGKLLTETLELAETLVR